MSHLYIRDTRIPLDHRGHGRCQPPCGLPERNRVHVIDNTELSAETAALTDRMLGENTNEEHPWPRGGQ